MLTQTPSSEEDEKKKWDELMGGGTDSSAAAPGWEQPLDLLGTQDGPARTSAATTAAEAPPQPQAGTVQAMAAPGGQTMMPPPPPPPPPSPTPGLGGQLEGYASDWMTNPNRYMSDFVTAQREAGDQRRALAGEEASRNIDEWISSRGLVGSSIEGDQQVSLQRQLAADLSQEESALMEKLASIESMDRLSAGEFGLDVYGEQSRQGTTAEALDIERAALDLELKMQTNDLTQRESEFARTQGLNEREFIAGQDQFAKTYGEQVQSRLQQNAQFAAALSSDEARFAVDAGLRQKALDLQEQGMTADDAFRQAALAQERELTEGAQELERYGIDTDSAYRYTALAQDSGFRAKALELQEKGMSLDEAFRQAELDYRQKATQQATMVQLLQALISWGGMNADTRKIMEGLLGPGAGAPEPGTGDPGTGYRPQDPTDPGAQNPGDVDDNVVMSMDEWLKGLRI